ncbi:MAG: hypothetical protein WBX15_18685 [Thermoanaerobaculia bacterium]
MKETETPSESQGEHRPDYEKPAIAWEQQLDAAAVGVSCSKTVGDTGCQIGGTFS